IDMLVTQITNNKQSVETAYKRGVTPDGNKWAIEQMYKVFEVSSGIWRGIGAVPESGLIIRKEYEHFDAEKQFSFDPGPVLEHKGCICGEILRGVKTPLECKLFSNVCNPDQPVGPCMVSSEGTCSAYYLYGEHNDR
ncbi:MAG: hydrogenase formation protein HypD, partial [Chloroflexi bacterium]|nr:hydrogenase formation protein HypD [Chloroflexota bacterium]